MNQYICAHIITIAYCIIKNYKSGSPELDEILAPSHIVPAPLKNLLIPGSVSNVYDALDLLRAIQRGMTIHVAIQKADSLWLSSMSDKEEMMIDGQNQANIIKPKLIQAIFDCNLIKESPKEYKLKTLLI